MEQALWSEYDCVSVGMDWVGWDMSMKGRRTASIQLTIMNHELHSPLPWPAITTKILQLQPCDKGTNLLRDLTPAKEEKQMFISLKIICLDENKLTAALRGKEERLVSPPYIRKNQKQSIAVVNV